MRPVQKRHGRKRAGVVCVQEKKFGFFPTQKTQRLAPLESVDKFDPVARDVSGKRSELRAGKKKRADAPGGRLIRNAVARQARAQIS